MTRVHHLLSPALVGGAERVVLDGGAAQRELGAEVTLCLLRERRAPEASEVMAREAKSRGLAVIEVNVSGRLDAAALRSLYAPFASADVVHAHGYKALSYATLSCAQPHRRLFATFHGTTSHTPDVLRFERLERALFASTRRVFVPSVASAERLVSLGVEAARLQLVANPVGLRPLDEPAPQAGSLLFIGRLSPEKGLDVLLAALARSTSGLRLEVVGDGPERASLEALAATLGLRARVRFQGLRRDVRPALAAAEALVMPSLREGLPVAALEARVAGLPLLASRVGGLPSLVEEGVDGVLVAPGDLDGWRRALDAWPSRRAELAQGARAVAPSIRARFSPRTWAAQTLAAYHHQPNSLGGTA